MKRQSAGQYVGISTATERARAFIPAPLPPDPPIEWSQELRAKFDRALLALGRLDAIPTFLPESSLLIPLLSKKEAVLSSLSEEKLTSIEELLLFSADAENSSEGGDVAEIHRLSTLIPWIWEVFSVDEPDFIALIKEAHRRLFPPDNAGGIPSGDFRTNHRRLSVTQPGNAAFIPPPAENILDCMSALQRFLNDRPTPTPFLVKAALAQAQFEMIQPFASGNSRLARMIPMMLMREHKVVSSPIVVTSFYFAGHRKEYYDALNGVRANGDWESWLGYYADAVATSAERSFEAIQMLTDRVRKDLVAIQKIGRPAESAMQVFNAMIAQPLATSNWLVAKTGITPATVNKSLVHLGDIGVINETTSKKRNRIFAYTRYIEILKNDIRDIFA